MSDRQLTKNLLKIIREDFNKVTSQYRENLKGSGYTLELGNCSYNPDEATFKLHIRVDGAKTKGQKDLAFWSKLEGVDPTIDHTLYELVEYNTKGRKYPWIYRNRRDGQMYKASTQWAKANFPMEAK